MMLLSTLKDKQGKPVLAKTVGGRREGAQKQVNQRRPVQLECSQTQQRAAAGTYPGRDRNYLVEERVWGRIQIAPDHPQHPTYWKKASLKDLDQVLWATRSPDGYTVTGSELCKDDLILARL